MRYRERLAPIALLVLAPMLILGLLAFIVNDAAKSYQPSELDCLCLDGPPPTATPLPPETIVTTVTVQVPVVHTRTVTRHMTMTVPITRYVAITLPHAAITGQLRLMFDGELSIPRVGPDDIRAMQDAGGCYITDMFPAKIGGIYYHIYVCMLVEGDP